MLFLQNPAKEFCENIFEKELGPEVAYEEVYESLSLKEQLRAAIELTKRAPAPNDAKKTI